MCLKEMLKKSQINYQSSKIKGFSLLEIIIAILILAIIASFAIPKFDAIKYNSNKSVLKSQLSLLQNALNNKKNKNILLSNEEKIDKLDNASIDQKNQKLFTEIIDFSILSTSTNSKELGKWVKVSTNGYDFFLSPTKKVSFLYEDEKIYCKSEDAICKEIE